MGSKQDEKSNLKTFFILKGKHILTMQAIADADISKVRYCIPSCYNEQIPILFSANGGFISYKILDDKGESNRVIEFQLPKMKKDDEIKIYISYTLLISKSKYDQIPKKIPFPKKDEIPDDIKKWLKPSASIQSNNILIKITSRLLKGFSNDMLWFIKKVMTWSAYHGSAFTYIQSFLVKHSITRRLFVSESFWLPLQDSLSTLIFGGQCIGKTNLAAALLRAMGIPARIVITSTIYYGPEKWLDSQHYIIEYYCPGFGWVRSQAGLPFVYPNRMIILRIVNYEEENIAGNGLSEYGGGTTWFWIDNKNISFGIVNEFNFYKLPKTQKLGFPTLKVWKEKKLSIPTNLAEDIEKLSKEVWELYTKNAGIVSNEKKIIFENAYENQKKAVELLLDLQYEKTIEKMIESKNLYEKL